MSTPQAGYLLTTHDLGAPEGRNIGAAGYSYEFVLRALRPYIEQMGPVERVPNNPAAIRRATTALRAQGLRPVHIGFLPYQDFHFAQGAANIVMPMWEFPDVPAEAWHGNRQYDWPATANRADLTLASGPFTRGALVRGGVTRPVRVVPVPVPQAYFSLPPWAPAGIERIDCPAYQFGPTEDHGSPPPAPVPGRRAASALGAMLLGRQGYDRLARGIKRLLRRRVLPYPLSGSIELRGVVYCSIFNPNDARKNWQGLIAAFLAALGHRDDATLVLKLATDDIGCVGHVIHTYRSLGPHRCRVAFICDYLSEETLLSLCRATAFYAHSTRAEGSCLPLMNHMAAGRPAISPAHSALGDYFDSQTGLVVHSEQEPAAWPHDREFRPRTTWARIDIDSLCRAFADSHALALNRPEEYAAMGARARSRMHAWAGRDAVMASLRAALADV